MDDIETKIKQWEKQKPNLNTMPMALLDRLLQASKQINEELSLPFQAYKLNDAGFDVLSALLRAGEPYALSPKELLAQMQITSGTMTTRIDKLEKKGLVKRTSKKEDKRGIIVALTKKGVKIAEEVLTEHVKAQSKIVSIFDEQEQLNFIALLQKYLSQSNKKKKIKKKKS